MIIGLPPKYKGSFLIPSSVCTSYTVGYKLDFTFVYYMDIDNVRFKIICGYFTYR